MISLLSFPSPDHIVTETQWLITAGSGEKNARRKKKKKGVLLVYLVFKCTHCNARSHTAGACGYADSLLF